MSSSIQRKDRLALLQQRIDTLKDAAVLDAKDDVNPSVWWRHSLWHAGIVDIADTDSPQMLNFVWSEMTRLDHSLRRHESAC